MDAPSSEASTQAPPPPPPPLSDPSSPRRLVRSSNDKVLGGVAGGLGAYFNIDAAIFRVGFVALALAGGSGLVLYVVAWLLLPDDAGCPAPVHSLTKGSTHPLQVPIVLMISVIILIGLLDHPHGPFLNGMVWPLALLGLGAYLWLRKPDGGNRPPVAPWTAAPAPAGPGDATAATAAGDPEAPGPDRAAGPHTAPFAAPFAAPPEPRPPRGPSITGPVLSILLVATGVAALLDTSGAADVSPETLLAVLLTVTGAGLVLSAWLGRGRGLIPVALLLTALLATTEVMDVPLAGGVGERQWVPLAAADLRHAFRLGLGEATLDLSELSPADLDGAAVEATVGMGQLIVLVPHDAIVSLDVRAGLGETVVFGYAESGMSNRTRLSRVRDRLRLFGPERGEGIVLEPEAGGRVGDASPDGPEIRIDARVGIGEVEVRRVAA